MPSHGEIARYLANGNETWFYTLHVKIWTCLNQNGAGIWTGLEKEQKKANCTYKTHFH